MADNQVTAGQNPGPVGSAGGSLTNLYTPQAGADQLLPAPTGSPAHGQPVPLQQPPANNVPPLELFEPTTKTYLRQTFLVPPDIAPLILPIAQASPDHVKQGSVFNCPFPAAMAALVHTDGAAIKTMLTITNGVVVISKESGTQRELAKTNFYYEVKFKGGITEKVSCLLYGGKLSAQATDANKLVIEFACSPGHIVSWISYTEKAYAKNKGGYDKLDWIDPIVVTTDVWGNNTFAFDEKATEIKGATKTPHPWTKKMLVERAGKAGSNPTIACTRHQDVGAGLDEEHCYAVLGLTGNAKDQKIKLYDSLSLKKPEISQDDFMKNFFMLLWKP